MRKTLLQALLAAFCAIPFALRSLGEGWVAHTSLEGGGVMLINMRNAMLSGGKRRPTARDYVQDGLVAMWDGIENAGWGVHDPNATTWKDLVSGWTFKGCSFTDNACTVLSQSIVSLSAFPLSQFTSEIVVARLAGTTQNHSYTNWQSVKVNGSARDRGFTAERYPNNAKQYAAAMNIDPVVVSDNPQDRQYIAAAYNYTNGKGEVVYYHNGEIVDIKTAQQDLSFDSQIVYNRIFPNNMFWRISLYSRALTADEVAANHAIDKARFNLPDA